MMYYFSIKTFFQTFFSVIFFLSVIFTGGLHAQTAVLPFHASGSTSLFSIVDAPIYLQEVFHFYFEKQKNYPLVDLHKTNAALRELNFQPENLLNRQSAGRICSSTGAEYLLTGSADFHSRSQIALSAVAYSCRSGKEVKKKEIGSVKNLQSIVSKLVNSASSYAQSKPQKTAAKNSSLNLYVILDLSGSMSFDLPQIKKALNSISEELPPGSNLDAYLLKNSRVEMMKSRGSLNEIKRRILKEKTSGKSSKNMFLQALTMVEKNFRWGGNNRLIILSDVSFPSGRMNDVESKLRRMKSRGMEIHSFLLSGQGYTEKKEWKRLSRTLGLKEPGIVYGRRVGFLEGYSRMFIMHENRFYVSDLDIAAYINKNELPDSLEEIQTVRLDRGRMNLNEIAVQYARDHNLKIGGYGPVLSGLEFKIHQAAASGTARDRSYSKVLVKNKGKSFWIQISDRETLKQIAGIRGAFYVGLQFYRSDALGAPENIPEFVYYKKQRDVPRLLINEWSHFTRLPNSKISSSDIWFFLVTAERIDDGRQTEDIRK